MIQEKENHVDDPAWYFDLQQPPVDPERWKYLRDRVADELKKNPGQGVETIARAAGVDPERLDMWLRKPNCFQSARRVGEKPTSFLIAEALERYFEALDKAGRNPKDRCPFRVETSVTQAVIKGIELARFMRETVLIDAASGLGKTESVNEYIARARKGEGFDCPVWTIELNEYCISPKAILSLICTSILGEDRYESRPEFELSRAILGATEGKNGVLIIDEGQHTADATKRLGMSILNGLRSFPDKGAFGIAILGSGETYRRLKTAKYAQLLSRVEDFRVDIAGLGQGKNGQHALTENDVFAVMSAWGAEDKEYCLNAARQSGALRTMTNIFRMSMDLYGTVDSAALRKIRRF